MEGISKQTKEREAIPFNGSETLYAFCGWLTTRHALTLMSANHNSAPIAALIGQFCRENGLDEPRAGWENNVKHMEEEPAPSRTLPQDDARPLSGGVYLMDLTGESI